MGATADMAERLAKPLVFVVNAATLRARITGEAAVALSQHGTVAPITIHHRVDFAASMVDGRTVGEVVPKSASAKEIGDLWIYLQDRLARLKKDEMPAPEARTQRFSVSSLSSFDEPEPQPETAVDAEEFLEEAVEKPVEPPTPPPPAFVKPPEEVRPMKERFAAPSAGSTLFGGVVRPFGRFGRRQTDNVR